MVSFISDKKNFNWKRFILGGIHGVLGVTGVKLLFFPEQVYIRFSGLVMIIALILSFILINIMIER